MKSGLKATEDGKISFDFIETQGLWRVCISDSGVNSCLWLEGIQGAEH